MPNPSQKTTTFRDQTSGKIADFIADEGCQCALTQDLLSYISGAIVHYKDEGVEISPSIVISSNISAFLKSFPGAVTYQIGELPLAAASGPKILKDCAPLFGPNWSIYIERVDGALLRYGVFSYFRLPTTIPLDEGMELTVAGFGLLVRKVSDATIEMRGAKGNRLTLIFSTLRETPDIAIDPVEKFSNACALGIGNSENAEKFKVYLRRLLATTLASSHGTILVCREAGKTTRIAQLRDSVAITPPIDFLAAYLASSPNDAGSVLELQRNEELLAGFTRCDGVIMFDTEGKVTAYRAFYKNTGQAAKDEATVVGGARRRAFEGIKALVGSKLTATLFRSQDGLTLVHGGA